MPDEILRFPAASTLMDFASALCFDRGAEATYGWTAQGRRLSNSRSPSTFSINESSALIASIFDEDPATRRRICFGSSGCCPSNMAVAHPANDITKTGRAHLFDSPRIFTVPCSAQFSRKGDDAPANE